MITAGEFKKANDESPVVAGSTIYKRPKAGMRSIRQREVWGGRYRLEDGRVFAVKSDELRKLPETYPRWRGI